MLSPRHPLEPMSLLGSSRPRIVQPSFSRSSKPFLRHLQVHCSFNLIMSPNQPRPFNPLVTSQAANPLRTPLALEVIVTKFSLQCQADKVCNSFNSSGCIRQRCRFLHVCNFCGGAHANLFALFADRRITSIKKVTKVSFFSYHYFFTS